jgi:nitrite reductase (NADH) large subunit
MKVVTVGTGMASADFVQQLRQEGFTGEIVMISDEPYAPYSPCVIPFYLAGDPLESVFWKGSDFYQRQQVTPLLEHRVVEIDREQRLVRTAQGACESYDRLFYAAGSRCCCPQPDWLQTAGVFGFKTLTDMVAIDRHIRQQRIERAVVFGGGFIGVDAALALHHRGIEVTLVHRNDRLLSQMTDEEGGRFATERLAQKAHFDLRLQNTLTDIAVDAGQLRGVTLADGTTLDTKLLIVATGVTPNSAPLTGADDGVEVGAELLTEAGIYAAGDVALTRHLVCGTSGLYATYPNAQEQARVAARHLVHGYGHYHGSLNTNVLQKHIDFPVISVGAFKGEAVTWRRGDLFRRVYLQDGRINGYILIGDTRLAGHIHHLYVTREPIENNIREILADRHGVSHYRNLMQLQTPVSV